MIVLLPGFASHTVTCGFVEFKLNTECVDWVRKQALIARRYQLFIVKIDDVTSPNLMWRHCQFVVDTKSLLKHD